MSIVKNLLVASAVLAGSIQAANLQKVPTTITCQQDDGDVWVEFGLHKVSDSVTEIIVVQHVDDKAPVLLARDRVFFTSATPGRTTWVNRMQTIKAVVYREFNRDKADFSLIQDGPGSIREEGMLCYKNNSISFKK